MGHGQRDYATSTLLPDAPIILGLVATWIEDHNTCQTIPAPADDLEVGEVGLPQLVGRRGLVLELLGRLDDDVGGAGDQVVRFQQSIDRGLRDEVLFLIGEAHRQFAWAEFGQGERQVDDLVPDRLGYPVPDAIGPGAPVTERLRAAVPVAVVPSIKGRPRDAELLERPACRQVGGFDQPDDLDLLGCGVSHAGSPPSPVMLFFSRRFSRVRSATTSFSAWASRRRSLPSSDVAARAVSPASLFLPASRNSLDHP